MKVPSHLNDLIGKNPEEFKLVNDELSSSSSYKYEFGLPSLDIPMGGIQSGKVYEFFGPESQGKSTFAQLCVIPFVNYWVSRKENKIAVLWIESESALDMARARFMGVPVEYMVTKETDIFETGTETIKNFLKRCVDKKMKLLIVWDTIAAASTRNEKESGKVNGGGLMEKPRLIKQFFREITNDLGVTNSTLILLNQVYTKMTMFGDPFDSPGGMGIKHHASVRSRVQKVEEIEEVMPNGKKFVRAIAIELRHVKNKLTTPKQRSYVVIDIEKGIDYYETNYRFMKNNKLLGSKGGGYSTLSIPTGYFKDGKQGEMIDISFQGGNKFRELCETKYPHLMDWINYKIYIFHSNLSPLIKVRIIDKIWDFEKRFFGKPHTNLTEEEKNIADMIHSDLSRGIGVGDK